MSIHSSNILVMIDADLFPRESRPRRVSCLLVDSEMQKMLAKAARSKHADTELFLVSLHFDKELESIQTKFGLELDTQRKDLMIEFVEVTKEPQRIPLQKGFFR